MSVYRMNYLNTCDVHIDIVIDISVANQSKNINGLVERKYFLLNVLYGTLHSIAV